MKPTSKDQYLIFHRATGDVYALHDKQQLRDFMADKNFKDYIVYTQAIYLGPTKDREGDSVLVTCCRQQQNYRREQV